MAAKQDKDLDEQLHAMNHMVYAELQLARGDDARRAMTDGAAVPSAVATARTFFVWRQGHQSIALEAMRTEVRRITR